jgi:hypothetical protein
MALSTLSALPAGHDLQFGCVTCECNDRGSYYEVLF